MSGIYDILTDIRKDEPVRQWTDQMVHEVPTFESVDRVEFITEACRNRVVLDIGGQSGDLHAKLREVATRIYGIDKEESSDPTTIRRDLDIVPDDSEMPFVDLGIEVIVLGEVLEHLANPGYLLQRLAAYYPDAELLVTVPNAFSAGGSRQIRKGIECVNSDHVAWYSWHTLDTLLKRYGYLAGYRWYNGEPLVSEGLVAIARIDHDKD